MSDASSSATPSSDLVLVTCALTGVLTNPKQHPVPVTPEEMAAQAREAVNAGASILHLHFRDQTPGLGHLPSWDPEVAGAIAEAIRAACPGVLLNFSTGVLGPDLSGPIACLRRGRPELAALNAGTLNYLKTRSGGAWAWPPMVFDNPVEKVEAFVTEMKALNILPECECFDTGIVRSIPLYQQVGLLGDAPSVSFVMGVASGMPAKPSWLPLLIDELPPRARWQVIAIGREDVWPLHRAAAERGGHLRTGLEDTFYLPDGGKAHGNGPLIEALVKVAQDAGRKVASPAEARALLGIA